MNFESLIFNNEQCNVLSYEEEIYLIKCIEHGDNNAVDELVMHNQRLVYKIAKAFASKNSISIDDLIQEGNLGLLKAITMFDWRKGFKFSTYATNWIKQYIQRYIEVYGRAVRVPVHVQEVYRKIKNKTEKMAQLDGVAPSYDEIANELEIDVDKIKFYSNSMKDIRSLDSNVKEYDDFHLIDMVADEKYQTDFLFNKKYKKEFINMILKEILSEREYNILCYRFGLNGSPQLTLEEVGNLQNITRERVRQIEKNALKKITNSRKANELKCFLE